MHENNNFESVLPLEELQVEDFNLHFSPDFILAIIYDENEEFFDLSQEYNTHPSVIEIERLCTEYDSTNYFEVVNKIDNELVKLIEEGILKKDAEMHLF